MPPRMVSLWRITFFNTLLEQALLRAAPGDLHVGKRFFKTHPELEEAHQHSYYLYLDQPHLNSLEKADEPDVTPPNSTLFSAIVTYLYVI